MAPVLSCQPPRAEHESKANCWDNAVAESFFGSLKRERIKKHIYKTRALASADVADYIDTFYMLFTRFFRDRWYNAILPVATVTLVASAPSNLKRLISG